MRGTLLLTISIVFLLENVRSQTYVTLFGEPSRQWTTVFSGTMDADCLDIYTDTYFIGGDSLINELSYRIVRKQDIFSQSPIMSMFCNGSSYSIGIAHLVREQDKRVYVLDGLNEYMIYDFNAEVGDSVPYPSNFPSNPLSDNISWATVNFIDSIEIDGSYRKRFVCAPLDDSIEMRTIIEGIGGYTGPFHPLDGQHGLSHQISLECVKEVGIPVYGDGNCASIAGITSNDLRNYFKFFPNPTTNMIQFGSADIRFEVFDALGNKLFNGTGSEADFSSLDAGTYFLRATSLDKVFLGVHIVQVIGR